MSLAFWNWPRCWETEAAAEYDAFPVCDAVTEHVPVERNAVGVHTDGVDEVNATGSPEVAGPMIVACASAARTDLLVASAKAQYWAASGFGFQKSMFGSFQISQMMERPVKCLAEAAAHWAKAATLSGC